MKNPFSKYVGKRVELELKSGETCKVLLHSCDDEWLTCVNEQKGEKRLIRQADVKEMRLVEDRAPAQEACEEHLGRITDFDPEKDIGHIQEQKSDRCWFFRGDSVSDQLLTGMLLSGKTDQLVRYLQSTGSSLESGFEAVEVKPLSHHALRAKTSAVRWFHETMARPRFLFKAKVMLEEHQGVVFDYNRGNDQGQIRESESGMIWVFRRKDVRDKTLFNRVRTGELGMRVSFWSYGIASSRPPAAKNIRMRGPVEEAESPPTPPAPRTTSGRITAYYIDRGFGFVLEAQSSQVWYFHRHVIVPGSPLMVSLERGELDQFVTFSGIPQPPPGRNYPTIELMQGSQTQQPVAPSRENDVEDWREGMTYVDARSAEQHGEFSRAEAIYVKILPDLHGPEKAAALKGYAHLLNRLNRANEAIDLVERNRDIFDAKSRLGMLSIFYRKANRYLDAAGALKQMALNIGLPKDDEKRISYIFQGVECFCGAGDFGNAKELLSYLPNDFDKTDPRFVMSMKRIGAGTGDGEGDITSSGDARPAGENETTKVRNAGFQYPELAKERLASCRYVGLNPQRQEEGNFSKSDLGQVSSLLRGSASIPPSVVADYYLTMAKISDDIGESAMYYLYKHFLFSAIDAMYGARATPPRSFAEEALCDIVQAFWCTGPSRFHVERLWALAIESVCERNALRSVDEILRKFTPGNLISAALEQAKESPESCNRCFQMFGIIRRYIPESAVAFLLEALKTAGWDDGEDVIAKSDSYLCLEGPVAELTALKRVDERSLLEILSHQSSIGELPSALDRDFSTAFVSILRTAADYASRQSSFSRCTEAFGRLQAQASSFFEKIKARRSVFSVCLLKPAVLQLLELVTDNYEKHKGIRPEISMFLRSDDAEDNACMITEDGLALRFRVGLTNEAAPPVHNLRFTVKGTDEETPRAECLWPVEFAGDLVDLEMPPFQVTEDERQTGALTIVLAASYDTLLGDSCHCEQSFAVKIASSSASWQEINPNPYAGTASGRQVDDDNMFFGRVSLMADIVEDLRQPDGGRCFVLYGQKRSGKTSVMEAVCRRLVRTEQKCVISCFSAQSLIERGSARSLLSRFALTLWKRVMREFDDHRFPISSDFPLKEEIYDNPIDAIERVARAIRDEGCFWIVTIDEFTSLHQESPEVVDAFMHNWKAMLQARLFNALIIGQDTMPKFMDEHPNDFCVSHNIRLSYLTKEECGELASKPIAVDGMSRYRENSLDKIYDWTLGSPYLVQKFCFRLVKRLNANRRTYVVDADIAEIAKEMYSGGMRMPEAEFDSFIVAGDESWSDFDRQILMETLIAVAKESRITGWAPIDSIVRCADEEDEDNGSAKMVLGAIEDLVKREALIRFEGKLKIPVKLFAEWLRINM